ncbi:MAG: SAM-dependent chlorinase/fluorinase [Bacteroidales bacterium]|jgi:S-adenosylmethionine hydrolase|nr:SAM-dependent chlorinase/fluorinase [Bacteroidales bacterium]
MAVVTLTTGWVDDYHVAVLKGVLVSALHDVQIVDLSHQTPVLHSGIDYAAYMIKHCYKYYPKGTVHLISVESEYRDETPFVAALYNEQYFIGTDNGIFSLIFDSPPENMVVIKKYTDEQTPNYPAISVFAPAAVHLASGGDILDLGTVYPAMNHKSQILPILTESSITGTIIHVNAFGNAVTNITREEFEKVGKGRPFEIMVQGMRHKITRINKYFHETTSGEQLALFNFSGYVEVALNNGKIAEVQRLVSRESNVLVKFINKQGG